jgi:hypothetical protein
MNDVDKRLEEKLERILSFDSQNSTKLSQSTMSHAEHSQLILEVLEEDVPDLISQLQQLQQEKERYKKALGEIYHISTFDHDIRFPKDKGYDECIRLAKQALEDQS